MRSAEGLEYAVHGEGDPVLLIHGSHLADALLPLTSEPDLADHFQLIRYHRRGFAGSAPHAGSFSIEEQAEDALRPVRELGLERLHVVGYSYGAVTAVQLSLQAPEVVHSLVLLEPPLWAAGEAEAAFEMFLPVVDLYRSGDARGAVDAFMAGITGSDWRTEASRTVPGGPEQADGDATTFFEVEIPALREWHFDGDKASRISQPVLYLSGSESGPLFERPKQLFLSCVPHAESAVLPGLDHLLMMRDPGLVARPIADFLARHPLAAADGA